MFGHQDEDQNHEDNQAVTATASDQVDTSQPAGDSNDNNAGSIDNSNNGDGGNTSYLDNLTPEPLADDKPDDDKPAGDDSKNEAAHSDNNDLLDIKRQALEELSPLVGHLEQNPEEKFKTTMMMIQGNDNQSLIPEAYKAAKDISDDKARAQALLDIVNEINYFTHKN